ncbi:MAG TPA: pyrroline-5-carboxylate reductase [Thermoanaerobaculia bacterium]|nr:pyrroline-5-carboxylate reductase [Thermoanaerobaculia bacterium]
MSAPAEPLALGRIAVLGAGTMGETLIRGLLTAGVVTQEQIHATAGHEERAREVEEELGVSAGVDNRAAVAGADVVLLCVKPQGGARVLGEIAPVLQPRQLLISILAGVDTSAIERRLTGPVPVVRAMPNTPSLVGAGMTVLCAGRHAGDSSLRLARRLFVPLGRTLELEERHFDAVTGLSASGPAFVYLVIEALADGGVKVGLPRGVATEMAAQACLGAATMVLSTGSHPALLKDEVTTPGGCTVDGLLKLEEGGLRVTMIKAVVEASAKAGQLGPEDVGEREP